MIGYYSPVMSFNQSDCINSQKISYSREIAFWSIEAYCAIVLIKGKTSVTHTCSIHPFLLKTVIG